MSKGGPKKDARILVCGHAGIQGTSSSKWGPGGTPNPVDYDVAILDLSTVPASLVPLRVPQINDLKEKLGRLLMSAGQIIALLDLPDRKTKVLGHGLAAKELEVPVHGFLPIEVSLIPERGETVELGGSDFDWYLARMRQWTFHLSIGEPQTQATKIIVPIEIALLAKNREGRALAMRVRYSNGGSITVLPVIPGSDTRDVVDRIAAQFRPQGEATPTPDWAHALDVPGYSDGLIELTNLQDQADEIAARIQQQKAVLRELDAWRGLLFETGPVLEQLVANAMRLLGIDVLEKRFGNEEYVVEIDGSECLVEVKGRNGSATLTDCRQINDHVLDAEDTDGVRRKGILIANCWRLDPPEIRGNADRPEFPANVIDHAQRNEIALVSSRVIFAAVTDALRSPSAAAKWRRALVATSGVVPLD